MFGIGQGPNGEEQQQYQNLSGTSSTATNMGLGDLTQSTDFMKAIVSGDPTKIGQVIAPQIAGIKGQGQEQKQILSEFGNRSGGTNAKAQMIDDSTRKQINDLISSLTGSAVSGLASTGSGLLNTGVSGFVNAFGEGKTMQTQTAAKWNDLFKSIAATATGVLGGIGNLDTTGASTTGEQFKNFFTGVA